MILVPFPRFVFPTESPPFWPLRRCRREGFREVESPAFVEILRQGVEASARSSRPGTNRGTADGRSGRAGSDREDPSRAPPFARPTGSRPELPADASTVAHGHPASCGASESEALRPSAARRSGPRPPSRRGACCGSHEGFAWGTRNLAIGRACGACEMASSHQSRAARAGEVARRPRRADAQDEEGAEDRAPRVECRPSSARFRPQGLEGTL